MICSEMLSPCGHDLIEVFEDDLANFAPQARGTVERKVLNDVETLRHQPIFAFRVALYRVYMHRFVTFVRVKKESPTQYIQNCWHRLAFLIIGNRNFDLSKSRRLKPTLPKPGEDYVVGAPGWLGLWIDDD